MISRSPTLAVAKSKTPYYLPNAPDLAMLPPPTMQPPPRTRLALGLMRDFIRIQLIEEMHRLNIPYSHTTKKYVSKK